MYRSESGNGLLLNVADLSETLHFVIFVRDTFRIDVDGNEIFPPKLSSAPPDLAGILESKTKDLMTTKWPEWWESVCRSVVDLYSSGYADRRNDYLAESVLRTRNLFFSELLKSFEVDSEVLLELSTRVTAEWRSWFFRERRSHHIEGEPRVFRHRALVRSIVEDINTSDPKGRLAVVTMLQLNVVAPWIQHRDPGIILHSPDLFDDKARFYRAVRRGYLTASELVAVRSDRTMGNRTESTVARAKLPDESGTTVGVFDNVELVIRIEGQFVDGMELRFKVVGDLSPLPFNHTSNVHDNRPAGTVRNGEVSLGLFQGLLVEVAYPIANEEGIAESLTYASTFIRPIVKVFQREPFDPKSLWLWVTPTPPAGIFDLSLQWPEYRLEYKTWRFEATGGTT